MLLNIKHQVSHGAILDKIENVSYCQFIKHLAFSGMGVCYSKYNLCRFFGYMIEFMQYWNFDKDKILVPNTIRDDPTELGQLSNRIGKAYADILAKSYYKSLFSFNYEHVMRSLGLPVKGQRPDLYCFSANKQFAIESKGYTAHSVSEREMNKHKSQSQSGPLKVNFSIASVAYSLYKEPKVKFYDPVIEDIAYQGNINKKLIGEYYHSIFNMLAELNTYEVARLNLLPLNYRAFALPKFSEKVEWYLLLHKSIRRDNMNADAFDFESVYVKEDVCELYVDVDGVGLYISKIYS